MAYIFPNILHNELHNDGLHSKVVRPMMSCLLQMDSFVFSLTILEALVSSMQIPHFNRFYPSIQLNSCIYCHCGKPSLQTYSLDHNKYFLLMNDHLQVPTMMKRRKMLSQIDIFNTSAQQNSFLFINENEYRVLPLCVVSQASLPNLHSLQLTVAP